jgi:hypothetical protein
VLGGFRAERRASVPDVYQLLEDRFFRRPIEDLQLEEDRFDEALSVLGAVDEFLIRPIQGEIEGPVTYAEFGRMIYWAENLRLHLDTLVTLHAEIYRALNELAIKDESRAEVHA